MKLKPALGNLLAIILVFAGCGPPPPTSISDPRLAPYLRAIAAADRAPLGFTPIPAVARVQLEEDGKTPYDAMLHIYADTSRTVAFRKKPDGYQWIAEQETFYGPKSFTNIDGTFQEFIVVEYQIEPLDGIPTNQLYIRYYGEDKLLAGPTNLTLSAIKPILEQWKGTPIR